jgi:hypothetical protein
MNEFILVFLVQAYLGYCVTPSTYGPYPRIHD